MRLAIIETGGKQYIVSPGQTIKIETLPGQSKGANITFSKVLFIDDGKSTQIGTPYVAGAKVEGELVEEGRNEKILVLRYKAKTRMRRLYGHRQPFVKVEIK